MGDWYDEEMPGQMCPYTRDEQIARRNLEENLNSNKTEKVLIVIPAIGSRWKHYNGLEYTVLYIANLEGGKHYKETVVYQGDNGKVWTRELEDWYRSFSAQKTFKNNEK